MEKKTPTSQKDVTSARNPLSALSSRTAKSIKSGSETTPKRTSVDRGHPRSELSSRTAKSIRSSDKKTSKRNLSTAAPAAQPNAELKRPAVRDLRTGMGFGRSAIAGTEPSYFERDAGRVYGSNRQTEHTDHSNTMRETKTEQRSKTEKKTRESVSKKEIKSDVAPVSVSAKQVDKIQSSRKTKKEPKSVSISTGAIGEKTTSRASQKSMKHQNAQKTADVKPGEVAPVSVSAKCMDKSQSSRKTKKKSKSVGISTDAIGEKTTSRASQKSMKHQNAQKMADVQGEVAPVSVSAKRMGKSQASRKTKKEPKSVSISNGAINEKTTSRASQKPMKHQNAQKVADVQPGEVVSRKKEKAPKSVNVSNGALGEKTASRASKKSLKQKSAQKVADVHPGGVVLGRTCDDVKTTRDKNEDIDVKSSSSKKSKKKVPRGNGLCRGSRLIMSDQSYFEMRQQKQGGKTNQVSASSNNPKAEVRNSNNEKELMKVLSQQERKSRESVKSRSKNSKSVNKAVSVSAQTVDATRGPTNLYSTEKAPDMVDIIASSEDGSLKVELSISVRVADGRSSKGLRTSQVMVEGKEAFKQSA